MRELSHRNDKTQGSSSGLDRRAAIWHVAVMKTLTLDEAQRALGSLAQRALRGEQILIRVEGSPDLLSLQPVPAELPENYLAGCYGTEETAQEEYLAGWSEGT